MVLAQEPDEGGEIEFKDDAARSVPGESLEARREAVLESHKQHKKQ